MAAVLKNAARFRPALRQSRVIRTPAQSTQWSRPLATATAMPKVAEYADQMTDYDSVPFFPEEPTKPTVSTSIPGPISTQAIKDLDKVFDTRSLNMIANYNASFGNYISDLDGNRLLDVYAQIASIPVCRHHLKLVHWSH